MTASADASGESHRRRAVRAALALLLLLGAALRVEARSPVAQEAQPTMRELVERLVDRPPSGARLETSRSVLAELAERPDGALEAQVRLALGNDLIALERFADAREHLVVAQRLAREHEDRTTLAHSSWVLGLVAFRIGEFESGVAWSAEGADVAEAIGRRDILWRCANVQGLILERTGDQTGALRSFQRGLAAATESSDVEGEATLFTNIGIARMNLGELEEARRSFLHVRDLEIGAGLPEGSASTLSNLGDVSYLLDEFDPALEYHQAALRMKEEAGSGVELAYSYHSLGAIHYSRGEYAEGLAFLERALELRRRHGLLPEQVETLMAMAEFFALTDEDEKASEAVRQSLEIADVVDMRGRLSEIFVALASVYEQQGDFEAALRTAREAWDLEREQRLGESRREYARFQAELDSKDQERRIAALEREREVRQLELDQDRMALDHERQVRGFLVAGSLSLAAAAIAGWGAWALLRRTHRALVVAEAAARRHAVELEAAADRIEGLEGLLPICAQCKSIRDDEGAWHALETYFTDHSEASFTHGLCPTCADECLADVELKPFHGASPAAESRSETPSPVEADRSPGEGESTA